MTRNSHLLAATPTTSSTLLLLCACFLNCFLHPSSSSTRVVRADSTHPINRDKKALYDSHRLIHRKHAVLQQYAVYIRFTHACGVLVVFLQHCDGARGFFKSPVCTYDQAVCTSVLIIHHFPVFPSCAKHLVVYIYTHTGTSGLFCCVVVALTVDFWHLACGRRRARVQQEYLMFLQGITREYDTWSTRMDYLKTALQIY